MKKNSEMDWKTVSRHKVGEYPVFDIYSAERTSPDGYTGSYIEVKPPLWVNVIAVIQKDNTPHYLMVRQFRHGAQAVTTEFPAGVVDPNEDPLVAAERELLEETGYSADTLIEIGSISPNPAIMSNRVYTYLAINPKKVDIQHLDKDERIDVLELPCDEVDQAMGSGEYDNGIIMIAWSFYHRYKKARTESGQRAQKNPLQK